MNLHAPVRHSTSLSVDEFSDWSRYRRERYEPVDGAPALQPWVERNPNRITVNIVGFLDRALVAGRFEIAMGAFAIPTGPRSIR